MRLTSSHALFYASRRMPAALARTIKPITIDECVNAHAGPDACAGTVQANRLIGELRGAPMASIRRELERVSNGTTSRYQAVGARWLKRIDDEAARRWWLGRAGLTGEALRAYDVAAMPPIIPDAMRRAIDVENLRKAVSYREISQYEMPENSGGLSTPSKLTWCTPLPKSWPGKADQSFDGTHKTR